MDRIANASTDSYELRNIYNARLYGIGGANEITDADLQAAGFDFTANDLANGVICAEQLQAFRSNQAVVQGDYGTTMDRLRGLA